MTALSLFDGAGDDEGPEKDPRLLRQIERVYRLMEDGAWRSLAEISDAVDAPEGSVSARLRDLRKPQWGAHDVRRDHLGDGLYRYRMIPSEAGLLEGDTDAPALRQWRECDEMRYCTAHADFHPPTPTRRFEYDLTGCGPDQWRRVRVLIEPGHFPT